MTRPRVQLAVSIDTEEDNWEPVTHGLSVENVRELPAVAGRLKDVGIRPTYFVNYQVVSRPWAAELLQRLADGGSAELAAHVHPWNTPPTAPGDQTHGTMLCNYPRDLQAQKIRCMTERFEDTLGRRPTAFRAGRFGLGVNTAAVLLDCGYRVDSSVTPFLSWERVDSGPSFVGAPPQCYRLDGTSDVRRPAARGGLIEVPLSVGYTRFHVDRWLRVARILGNPWSQRFRLGSVAADTGLLRRVILSPETNSVSQMLALSRRLVESGVGHLHMFLHSTSLRPGLSPFTRSRHDVRRMLDRIERWVDGLLGFADFEPSTVSEIGLRERSEGALGRTISSTSVRLAEPELRSPRAVIITYHFPPDPAVGSQRWAGLTKYLVRRGWDIRLVVGPGSANQRLWEGAQVSACHRTQTLNDLYREIVLLVRRIIGSRFGMGLASGTNRSPRRLGPVGWLRRELASVLALPDLSRGWMWRAGNRARRIVRDSEPDVVITSGPPHAAHLAGVIATVGTDVRLVTDMRDPWAGLGGAWRDDPVSGTEVGRLFSAAGEALVVRRARLMICNTPELAATFRLRYPGAHVTTVPNGVDLERIPVPRRRPARIFSVVHVGTLYGGRDPRVLIEGFGQFVAAAGIELLAELVFAGHAGSEHRDWLSRGVAASGSSASVRHLGVVSPDEALRLVSGASVAVVLAQDQSLQVPAKTYELAALGVPTIVVAERGSATARAAERFGMWVCGAKDPKAIAHALHRIYNDRGSPVVSVRDQVSYARIAHAMDLVLQDGARCDLTRPRIAKDRHAIRVSEPPRRHASDSLANWVWLAELERTERALELTFGESVMAEGLARSFARVDVCDLLDAGTAAVLPFDDGTFDYVTIHGILGRLTATVPASARQDTIRAVFRECHRVLRKGGGVYVATRNPHWVRRLLGQADPETVGWDPSDTNLPSPMPIKRTRAMLRRAGFADVQTFYVSPSHDAPWHVVPADRRTVARYELASAKVSLKQRLRSWLAGADAHRILYSSAVFQATR